MKLSFGLFLFGLTETITIMNLYTHFTLKDGQYTLSANSSSSKIGLRFYGHDADGNTNALRTVYGNNSIVYDTTNDGYNEYSLNLRVLNNYNETEFVNDICKPMFEIGNVAHAYQPYSLSRKAMRDDINALIYGIAEYRRNRGLHCTWEDVADIIGEIFNKEPHIIDYSAIEIEKELLRLIPKNFSLDNLLTLNKVMTNE